MDNPVCSISKFKCAHLNDFGPALVLLAEPHAVLPAHLLQHLVALVVRADLLLPVDAAGPLNHGGLHVVHGAEVLLLEPVGLGRVVRAELLPPLLGPVSVLQCLGEGVILRRRREGRCEFPVVFCEVLLVQVRYLVVPGKRTVGGSVHYLYMCTKLQVHTGVFIQSVAMFG